jgi:hypothetical protein
MPIRAFQTRRFPYWIRRALNITDTEVPASLAAERDAAGIYAPIQVVVDAYQGGIAIGDSITVNQTAIVTAGPVAQIVDLANNIVIPFVSTASNPSADPNYCFLVFAVAIAPNIAATRNPIFYMVPTTPLNTDVGGVRIAQPAIPTGGTGEVAWADMMHGGSPFFVPPGWTPCVYTSDLIAGESMQVFASLMRIPTGFKPF